MTTVLISEKALFWGGVDLQKIEVIWGAPHLLRLHRWQRWVGIKEMHRIRSQGPWTSGGKIPHGEKEGKVRGHKSEK